MLVPRVPAPCRAVDTSSQRSLTYSALHAPSPARPGRLRVLLRLYRVAVAIPTLLFYAVMAPFGYAMFLLLSLAPTRDRVLRARRLQWVMSTAFSAMHHWLRWVRVMDLDPRPARRKFPEGPFIVISNHPTLADGLSIMSAVPHVCTAVNRTTFNRWWLRPLLEGAGQFCGMAPNILGSGEVIERATERLRQGFRVLVFPEAHRSPRGGLRPFARGAFEIACKTGVPIVPVLMIADPLWLARGDSVFVPTAELPRKRLEVLETLDPSDFGSDSRAMRDYTEAMYRRLLGLPPAASSHEEPSDPSNPSRPTGAVAINPGA
jgi:1-acyl-sn-glycerol-3-phosphate acyltransferase